MDGVMDVIARMTRVKVRFECISRFAALYLPHAATSIRTSVPVDFVAVKSLSIGLKYHVARSRATGK